MYGYKNKISMKFDKKNLVNQLYKKKKKKVEGNQ